MRRMPRQKWEPAVLIRPKDNIKSSSYHKYVPFSPAYNKDRVNMFLLLAHDYARLWKAENKAVEVKRFEFAGEENERLYRRYVLRSLQKKRKVEEVKPRFIMKRFQNIPSKVRQYMRPPEVLQRDMEAKKLEKMERTKFKNGNKLSRSKDSTEIVREKLKKASSSEQKMDYDLANVSLCSEVMDCESDNEAVSKSSKQLDLSHLKVHPKMSCAPMRGHMHVLCEGPRIKVKNMPLDGHRHKCKLVAT